jgi:nucleoside-diphosphate-sugar epimerase
MVRWLRDGENLEILQNVPPQWYIDARDLGRVYLAAMVQGDINRERIFGFAGRYSWPRVLEIMKELEPEKDGFANLPDAGWDETDVPNESALTLLRATGPAEWTTLEKSVEDGVASFLGKV